MRIVTENLPPYNYIDTQEQQAGISIEIVLKLVEKLEISTNIEMLPWARAYRVATSEPNVLIFSILRTREREKKFHWLVPVLPVELKLYALPGAPKLNTLNDINRQSIGVLRGSSQVNFLLSHENIDNSLILLGVTYEHLYKMLMTKRIDYLMAPAQMVSYQNSKWATTKATQPVEIYKVPVEHQENIYLALSKLTDINTVTFIKNELEQILNKDEIQHLLEEFRSK